MKKKVLALALAGAMTLGTFASSALADILPQNRLIYFNVSNQDGAKYGANGSNSYGTYTDAYYIQAAGGGLNQLHITTDNTAAGDYGQVTTKNIATSTYSDTFYVSTTGGRGYNDDIILLFSMEGPISNDFSLSINASGYQWTPPTTASLSAITDYHYVTNALSETFTKDDFLYGPQTAKPGPGTVGVWSLPFYSGQNISDTSTAEYLMFVDLNLGNFSLRDTTDRGSVKVEFSLTGLYDTTAAFNVYAWCLSSNIGGGTIDWTNKVSTSLSDTGQSGYSINSTAAAPVPIPAAFWLLGSGFSGLFFMRRKKITA